MFFALAFFNILADLATAQMIFANWDLVFPQPGIVDYAGRTTDERCSKGQQFRRFTNFEDFDEPALERTESPL